MLNRSVPLIEQKASNWCWAASLEMVVKYHEPLSTINQCQLASYNINKTASPNMKSCCSCSNCNDCNRKPCKDCSGCVTCSCCHVLEAGTHNSCNQIMQSLESYRTKVINKIKYNATVFTGALAIETIEREINICQRPLIIVYNGFSHASTVIGSLRTPRDYIIKVNNPKDNPPCRAAVKDVNYSVSHPESSFGFVYNIYPDAVGNSCISTVRKNSTSKYYKRNDTIPNLKIENGIYDRLTDSDLKKIISTKEYYPIPVRYFSSKSFVNTSSKKLKVMNTTYKKEYIELVSEKQPQTVTIFQKNNNEWIPITISPFNNKLRPIYELNDSTLVLDNTNKTFESFCDNNTYEHIRYFDLGYDFYRFCSKGIYYIIPFYDYEILNNIKFINNNKSKPISERIFNQNVVLKFLKEQTLKSNCK